MTGRVNDHDRYHQLLAHALDEPLPTDAAAALEAHVAACLACQSVERSYRDERAELRRLDPMPVPRDLWARTAAALDAEVAREAARQRRLARMRNAWRTPSPSALVGAVTTVGLVAVVVANQVLPGGRSAGASGSPFEPTPTPFAVPPQSLAFVTQDDGGLRIYRTPVAQVCPTAALDCTSIHPGDGAVLAGLRDVEPESLAFGGKDDWVAIMGRDVEGRSVYAVLDMGPRSRPGAAVRSIDVHSQLVSAKPEPTRDASVGSSSPRPSNTASTRSSAPSAANPARTPSASEGAASDHSPAPSPPDLPSASAGATPAASSALASAEPTISEAPSPSTATTAARRILREVIAAGSPAEWSPDGEILAFSALPADRRHGPDIYAWRPGDSEATRLTDDHASYFASWAGSRIVASRVTPVSGRARGKETRLAATTVVIDPRTRETRAVPVSGLWLPVVDPTERLVIFWQGRLAAESGTAKPVAGRLYLADWASLDPFAEPREPGPLLNVQVLAPSGQRDVVSNWEVRWSDDGTAYAAWMADRADARVGRLSVYRIDPATGRILRDIPLLAPRTAREAFTMGNDRIAWVAPVTGQRHGELRVFTWGPAGDGGLRIRDFERAEGLPAF